MADRVHVLQSKLREWYEKPQVFVRECFGVEPDAWQDDVLEAAGKLNQVVMTACKGPGKSATLAWLGWHRLCTRIDCKGVAISITEDNLKDGLWAELAKWQQRSPFLRDQFVWTASRIFHRPKPELWWLSARSWPRSGNSQQQADSLAGLHADNIFILMDEAGGIPRSLLATAQAIGASSGSWLLALAGNPTNQDSALGMAVLNQRASWHVTEITGDPDDPKRTPRMTLEWARSQIEAWGRENPWVQVNVFGRFPASSLNTLISPDEVRDAQRRPYVEDKSFPLIFGVDVARFGDDESVIFPRRGKLAYAPYRMRDLDTIRGASHVSRMAQEKGADSIQIDATGGYGSGWYDLLKDGLSHRNVLPVQFGGRAQEDKRFRNKRAEMLWHLCEWIRDGGKLPPVDEMVHGLSAMQYTYTKDGKIQVEEKDQIKSRIGRSPDLEDAIACTFAYPVYVPRRDVFGIPEDIINRIDTSQIRDYDPWERYRKEVEKQHG